MTVLLTSSSVVSNFDGSEFILAENTLTSTGSVTVLAENATENQRLRFCVKDTSYQYSICNSTGSIYTTHVDGDVDVDLKFDGSDWVLDAVQRTTSFVPSDLPNIVHWYRAGLRAHRDLSGVYQWDDLISNQNGTQSADVHKPSLEFTVQYGEFIPKIRFGEGTIQSDPGTTVDGLHFSISINQPYSILLAWQRYGDVGDNGPDDSGDNRKEVILNGADDLNFEVLYSDSSNHFYCGSEITCSPRLNDGFAQGSDKFGVTVLTANGSSSSIMNNGVSLVTGDAGTNNLNGTLRLCDRGDYRTAAFIDVLEMCVFSGTLSNDTVSRLNDYYQSKYKLTF